MKNKAVLGVIGMGLIFQVNRRTSFAPKFKVKNQKKIKKFYTLIHENIPLIHEINAIQ
jgi:hypothetical protein